MKKIILCLLSFLLMVSAVSCSENSSDESIQSSSSQAVSSGVASENSENSTGSSSAISSSSSSSAASSQNEETSSQEEAGLKEDGTYVGNGYTCKAPEGWKLLEEDSSQAVFVPDNYPEKSADTISVQVSEKDASFDSYTREDFEAAAEKEYASLDAFQFSDYKKGTFGEFNMYMVEYSIKKGDVPIVFQQYFIDASEETITVIFASVNNSDLTEVKEAFLKSLTVK